MNSTFQNQIDQLKSSHHHLENYVNDVTDKCVSLDAHRDLQARTLQLEREVHALRQQQEMPLPIDPRVDLLMKRLEDFENSWSAATLESIEKTSMRLLAMEQRLESVARSQVEYIQRAGSSRRSEDRQIETNTRTIEIIEEETRSVKRQLTEALALFSKRKVAMGSPAILLKSQGGLQ